MMKYSVATKEPIVGEYYVVYCPDYCESQHEIARWDGVDGWHSDGFTDHVHDYVKAYYEKPISKW